LKENDQKNKYQSCSFLSAFAKESRVDDRFCSDLSDLFILINIGLLD